MADITRADVASAIAEEYGPTILAVAKQQSTALSAFPTVNMGTKVRHMPVLATLPEADWVGESATDPSGVKPTSKAVWQDRTLVAEELAVIVPVHENTIDDATEEILEELAGLGGQAIGKRLDQAIYFGTAKPASWTSAALLPAAVAAGQVFQRSTTPGENDLAGAILKAAGVVSDVGFDPSDVHGPLGLRFRLANLRNADGSPVFQASLSDAPGSMDMIQGLQARWVRNGAWNRAAAEAIVTDSSLIRIGVRQDVTVKFLDQATVGGINLAERDMVALRFKARYAYVLGNVATPESTNAVKVPVAAVTPAA
jgi:HK97 family phage major capsid protein